MPRRVDQKGSYDTEKCLRLIERHCANAFIGSSAVFVPMLETKRREAIDCSSVTLCCATFAFMGQKGRRGLQELFPEAKIYEGYGLTEGGASSVLKPGQVPNEAGSVGRPGINTRLKIVDDRGPALLAGEVGEIAVKGPSISTGYLDNPEETEAAFRNGWLHTGDLGKLDDRGFLYLVDRKKDMIKTDGRV